MAFSFPTLLLSILNLSLLLLSSSSFIPILLLKTPPTFFGWALVTISIITLLSSFIGLCSSRSNCCFSTHTTILLTSIVGLALALFAFFLREERSIELLGSRRNVRETRFLFRIEEIMLLGMVLVQFLVLVSACMVQRCGGRESHGMEEERRPRAAKVEEENASDAAMMAELKSKELDEKMKSKYGRWAKNKVEDCSDAV